MKKKEFLAFVAGRLDKSQKETGELLDQVFGAVKEALVEHGEVPLGDLGKLTVTERKARVARNMHTGEEIQVAAKNVPKFKPSKKLKESVL